MAITALRDDVLRVRVGAAGQLPEDASWAVLASSRTASVAVTPQSSSTSIGFRTTTLKVTVRKDPLELSVADLAGHVIAEDLPGRPIEYHGSSFRVYRKSPQDERYFGLGDKPGPLDRWTGATNLLSPGTRTALAGRSRPTPSTSRFPSSSPIAKALPRLRLSTTPGAPASSSTRNTAMAIRSDPREDRSTTTSSMGPNQSQWS